MAGETERLPDQPRPDRRNAFILLFFALMAIGAGNTMLLAAVLPQLTREMAMPDWMAGAVFSTGVVPRAGRVADAGRVEARAA